MNPLKTAINQMITTSQEEMDAFLSQCSLKSFRKNEVVSAAGKPVNEVLFICKGLLRVAIQDTEGNDFTIHFAMENNFIADYSAFIQQKNALYSLIALENMEAIAISREAINWGYANLKEGEKLGRLIAEHYFIYQDNRISNQYCFSPKTQYETLAEIFPDIHQRVPQHYIASYLGISSVHLSRIKNGADYK